MDKPARLVAAAAIAWCAGLGASGVAEAAGAPPLRFRYVDFADALPPGASFFEPRAILDDGRVFGALALCDEVTCSFAVGVYRNGRITALSRGIPNDANERGTAGGEVVVDPGLDTRQAALFRAGRTRVLPRLPGETRSSVLRLTDAGTALVASSARSGAVTYYLTGGGRTGRLPFGPNVGPEFGINERAVIAGTTLAAGARRAFRYQPSSRRMTLLPPLAGDAGSAGRAINARGDVLGWSYPPGSCGVERIGAWRGTAFRTYVAQGGPARPTHSSDLLWNRQGLVVLTRALECRSHAGGDMNSYLVPRPGVRLKLADLVAGRLPPWTAITGINARGDLIGIGSDRFFGLNDAFLLQRVNTVATAASVAPVRRRAARPAALARLLQARADELAREAGRLRAATTGAARR